MDQWHDKRDEWQKSVSGALDPPMEDRFLELEVTKPVAFDCARTVLGTSGGRRMRIFGLVVITARVHGEVTGFLLPWQV